MSDTELCFLEIAEAADLIRRKALSPVELTDAFCRRIEALNPKLDAYCHPTLDRAREDARHAQAEIAAGAYRGPLHGIPVALKDIYDTAGIPTLCGSNLHLGRVPQVDAHSVARLRDAGAVLLGKLTTHEFALGGPSWDVPSPPARNPWDTTRFTGGSSSGSGAATAAGLAMATMGSDTGGSIRNPAFFCGTSGIKPTYGRVSRRGVAPLGFSLDHCGPLTWTARDGALVLQAISGWDPADPGSAAVPVPDFSAGIGQDIADLRVGVVRHWYEDDDLAEESVCGAMREAERTLAGLGAVVSETRLSPLADWSACNMVIMLSEAYAIHESTLRATPEKYGEMARDRLMLGALLDASDVIHAQRMRRRLAAELSTKLRDFDALIYAGGWAPAPPLEGGVDKFSLFQRALFASPANVGGHPVVSTCTGFSPEGLPVGMQILAANFDEVTAIRIAAAYEAATPHRDRRPAL